MATLMKLPELGEDIEHGTVVGIRVAAADKISAGQIVMEVETDKVVVEIPAENDGRVERVLVSVGQEIAPGEALLEISTETEKTEKTEKKQKAAMARAPQARAERDAQATVLRLPTQLALASADGIVAAGPSARRLARELGVDIAMVKGSGPRGRIGKEDVKEFARERLQLPAGKTGGAKALPGSAADDERFGPVHRVSMTTIQQATAANMSRSWQSIPHAWLCDKIDITALETLRRQYKNEFREAGISLSLTPFLVKAVASALSEHAMFNARLDESCNEIVYLDYVDIGVAVDTERGLLVPCLRQLDNKSIARIAADLADLARRAQQGRLSLADMQGAGITVSNLGGFGLSAIYPLINWPQAAILGFAAYQTEQRQINEAWQARLMLPLTLAFDHRLINGADGARFIAHIKKTLEQPFRFALY